MAGYFQALHSTVTTINSVVYDVASFIPGFAPAIAAQVTSYSQQNVDPTWAYYLVLGVALAIGGFILVARGDSMQTSFEVRAPLQSQPIPAKQQE
jgi:hypothetical protein